MNGEENLIERATMALFDNLGWSTINCYFERYSRKGSIGRETPAEVVLKPTLRASLIRFNPKLPNEAIDLAVEAMIRDRSVMSVAKANQEIYRLLKDGIKVSVKIDGVERVENVRVINWDFPENNNYLLASQLWVTGDLYKRRADLVGFVNGIPLVFIELKASHKRLENAFQVT